MYYTFTLVSILYLLFKLYYHSMIQETNNVDKKCKSLKQCLLKPVEEVLGERKTAFRKELISDDIIEMMNERRR